ncbi:MAG: para-nitrobenzyl esterase [Pseudonocardiales bacterium]|nr:para-nitrobenzyl esterase [Pseudonocardiales bacterium]
MASTRGTPSRAATAVLVAAVLVAGVVVATRAAAAAPEPGTAIGAVVTVEQGEVRGAVDGDVLRYRGLPYAAPPVGNLRWAPPQPAPRTSGTRPATAPAPRCPQLAAAPGTPHLTAASSTEDCLTVDVTVPVGTTSTSRLPVLVWLHGGAFSAGAGGDVDPHRLAEAGPFVVVTANYRLGMLGFLGLPGLDGGGEFGLLDQQAALRWVHRNAAAFGGDPGRVTLGGESAGADSVCAQMASPAAAGLFEQAILQSGECGTADLYPVVVPPTAPASATWKPLPQVQENSTAAAGRLNCPDPATALACLRALPVDPLVGGAGVYWSPATGTTTLPARPGSAGAGTPRPMPTLVGTNRDEGTLFTAAFYDNAAGPLSTDAFRTMLASVAPTRAMAAGAAYPAVGRTPSRAWSDVVTDRAYACPELRTYADQGDRAPLYAYEFADPTAPSTFIGLPPTLADGVTHGAEMAYLFDLVPGQPAFTPAQQAQADRMVATWARFVTTGDPDGDGFTWPRWEGGGQVLSIGRTGATARPAAQVWAEHHCELWNG